MMAVASKIIFCLLLAALLGFIIGYLFAKMRKCDNQEEIEKNNTIQTAIDAKPAVFNNPLGEADDLKQISGIGPKIEDALNELGIFHFSQIAEWSDENIGWINNYLVFKGRVQRENWVEQAKTLRKGYDTEFSQKYKEK